MNLLEPLKSFFGENDEPKPDWEPGGALKHNLKVQSTHLGKMFNSDKAIKEYTTKEQLPLIAAFDAIRVVESGNFKDSVIEVESKTYCLTQLRYKEEYVKAIAEMYHTVKNGIEAAVGDAAIKETQIFREAVYVGNPVDLYGRTTIIFYGAYEELFKFVTRIDLKWLRSV